mgnify:FL=1
MMQFKRKALRLFLHRGERFVRACSFFVIYWLSLKTWEISSQDIRWKQRFQNYEKAFKRLSCAVKVVKSAPDDDLLQSGLVQTYEYTFELAWKTLKDYLTLEGFEVRSPRETIRQGFQSGYIMNGEDWLQALADRNLTTHIYDDEIIIRVLSDIFERYFFLLQDFYISFKEKANE